MSRPINNTTCDLGLRENSGRPVRGIASARNSCRIRPPAERERNFGHSIIQPKGQDVTIDLRRRKLGLAAAGTLALDLLAPGAVRESAAAGQKARMVTELRETVQSLGWIGAEAGIFRRLDIELAFPKIGTGSVESVAGLHRGEWEFAQTGVVPVAQSVLEGHDTVLILTPVQSHKGGFVMARRDIRTPEQLEGARVGVLTKEGPSSTAARSVLQRWEVSATLVPLGSFQAIYAALAAERIDAGYLPVDLSFRGRREFGWNGFQGVIIGIPGGVATTRRTIAANRELVAGVVKGFVNTIHFFKTRPEAAVPLLQRFLQFADRMTVEELREFHAPLFQTVPRPAVFFGMQGLKDSLSNRYPAAGKLQPSDIVDSSFIDELERSGYFQRLYSGNARGRSG